jgi:hypothetical protein
LQLLYTEEFLIVIVKNQQQKVKMSGLKDFESRLEYKDAQDMKHLPLAVLMTKREDGEYPKLLWALISIR